MIYISNAINEYSSLSHYIYTEYIAIFHKIQITFKKNKTIKNRKVKNRIFSSSKHFLVFHFPYENKNSV